MPIFKSAEIGTDFESAETVNTDYYCYCLKASGIYFKNIKVTLITSSAAVD